MAHLLEGRPDSARQDARDAANRERAMRAIGVSSLGLLITSGFELAVVAYSGSVALLSDALHNLGDVFTTVGVYFGFRVSRRSPSRRYPYGYGRAEDLAGIVIVASIWGSAVLAGWQSYGKLVSHRGTTHLSLGMIAAVVGIIGNQLVARYKLSVGKAINSAPLLVDARHSWLDAIASAGALVGLIGVGLGLRAADPVAGFAITILIVHIGIEATTDVVARLMDANDEETAKQVRMVGESTAGAGAITDVRVRWLGRQPEIRLTLRADANLSLAQAHEVSHRLEIALQAALPDASEITIIINPPPSR